MNFQVMKVKIQDYLRRFWIKVWRFLKRQPQFKIEETFPKDLKAYGEAKEIKKKKPIEKKIVCMYCGKTGTLRKVETGYVCERHFRYYEKDKGKNKNFETFEIKKLKLKCECGFREIRNGKIIITKDRDVLPSEVEMHCPKCGESMKLAKSQARIFRKQLRELGEIH